MALLLVAVAAVVAVGLLVVLTVVSANLLQLNLAAARFIYEVAVFLVQILNREEKTLNM